MLIKEYRVSMPCTVDEYFIGQLYMTAKSSQEETGKTVGEGIEILENRPFEEGDPANEFKMAAGQYTYKIMHLKSKLPSVIAAVLPDSMTDIHERSWNAFPHTLTVYSNEYYGPKFFLSVETMHCDDGGEQVNAVNLSPEDMKVRDVDYVDIAAKDSYVKFVQGENPNEFTSVKTGRGPFHPGFRNTSTPVMTAYKVVKLRFKVFGLQSKMESWGHQYGLRNPFMQYHRKICCWMDEWIDLNLADIRKMEEETAKITKEKLEASKSSAV